MIKPIALEDIPRIHKGSYLEDIEQFMHSDAEACEVFQGQNSSPDSIYSAYKSAATRSGYNLEVVRRKIRVFLIKAHLKSVKL